jgi:hypothetical protein
MSALLQGLSEAELAALETGLESARRELEVALPSKTDPEAAAT